MMHETFYTSGTYINKNLGIYFGWVCHLGSFSDCMPVWNETKDVCLIFTGEDFTDLNEIERLRIKEHKFGSENASYIVHLYEEKGLEFIESLNGWFSGVLVDLREKKIVLFNDRYGLGRIYYHESSDGFYFSSEAKALLKVLPELREINLSSLGETFSCGCVLQNRTLFSKISLLPGGSRWMFITAQNIKKDNYFSPEMWEKQPLLNGKEYYERLKDTFPRILQRYFRGHRRVGMSLTGGLDGRMIMAWANRAPGVFPCYTFGGPYRDCTDVRIARRVATLCQQSHETIGIDQDFYCKFMRLAEKAVYISDGTMDVSGSIELYMNKIAREIAPIRLTGNYGTEIIRGSVAFRPICFDQNFIDPEFYRLIKNASTTYERERQGKALSFIAFKQVPWHHYSRLSLEQSQLTPRSPYLDNDLVSLMYQAPNEHIMSREPSFHLIADGNERLARIPTDRGLLHQPIPVYTSFRNLYDEFTFRAEYAYDYGMPHWLAGIDRIFTPFHLERLFLGRHKFYHFRIWYRDKFSQFLKEILLDSRTLNRPYLNGSFLEEAVNSHIKGYRNYTSEISRILTSELIQRQLIEES